MWNEQKAKDTAAWQEQKAAEDKDPQAKARKAKEKAKAEREEANRRAWERDGRARARAAADEERRQQEQEQQQGGGGWGGGWGGGGGGAGSGCGGGGQQRPVMTAERRAHLRVLGLTGTQDDIALINKAYKLMALKYHPDRNGSVAALAMMKLVNNAHDFLVKG